MVVLEEALPARKANLYSQVPVPVRTKCPFCDD